MFLRIFFLLFISGYCFAQQVVDTSFVDNNYREDQFFIIATYNALSNGPSSLKQNGFSTSFNFGFIRDFPINKQRNIAIGVGLGMGLSSLNQNLLIYNQPSNNITAFKFLDRTDGSYSRNKLNYTTLDLPIEFRWRTSTAKAYNFWRIYPGIKFSYITSSRSKYVGDLGKIILRDIENFNAFQYGLTLSAGYSGVNLFMYYGFQSLFESGTSTIDNILLDQIISLQFGLSFYIL
ncbi:MAG: porin family protein [Flavobacteriaceae bacterium]